MSYLSYYVYILPPLYYITEILRVLIRGVGGEVINTYGVKSFGWVSYLLPLTFTLRLGLLVSSN